MGTDVGCCSTTGTRCAALIARVAKPRGVGPAAPGVDRGSAIGRSYTESSARLRDRLARAGGGPDRDAPGRAEGRREGTAGSAGPIPSRDWPVGVAADAWSAEAWSSTAFDGAASAGDGTAGTIGMGGDGSGAASNTGSPTPWLTGTPDTRFLPARFERYIEESAVIISSSLVRPSSGKLTTPIEIEGWSGAAPPTETRRSATSWRIFSART